MVRSVDKTNVHICHSKQVPVMAGYYSQPSLVGSLMCFMCEDDLWVVDISLPSNIPLRITTDGCCTHPHLSPDGLSVAYSSFVHGSQEVYTVSSQGGPALQLTHFGADSLVVGWLPDGSSVLFTSNIKQVSGNVDFIDAHNTPKRSSRPMVSRGSLNSSPSLHWEECHHSLSSWATAAISASSRAGRDCLLAGTRLMAAWSIGVITAAAATARCSLSYTRVAPLACSYSALSFIIVMHYRARHSLGTHVGLTRFMQDSCKVHGSRNTVVD